DGDGLSDEWEDAYDFSAADPSDAAQDADSDGVSNYEEFLDGTDPRSGASAIIAPLITTQPQTQEGVVGSSATFTVAASGMPVNYRWRLNGFELAGETNATLSIPAVRPADAGDYTALVYNAAGFDVSRPARLIVNVPPRITQHPQSARVAISNNVTFTVAAVGTGLLRYQWQMNGTNLPGATTTSLSLTNLQLEQSGDYRVIVTDDVASVPS